MRTRWYVPVSVGLIIFLIKPNKMKQLITRKEMRNPTDIRKAIKLLRWHTLKPTKPFPAYMGYKNIGRALGVKPSHVQHVCLQHFRDVESAKR